MPIKVTCEKCGGVLHAPDDAGGKKGRCPNCQNILPIPFEAPRGQAFGAPPAAGGFGFGQSPPAQGFGGAGSGIQPPPGMAFATPNPIPGSSGFPNADAKMPTAPPFGSQPPPSAIASSTPNLGKQQQQPMFGAGAQSQPSAQPRLQPSAPAPQPASPAGLQSSIPFGGRTNISPVSSALPISADRTFWLAAASGMRSMQVGVWLVALSLIAVGGVSIFGAYSGKALAEKPGLLKWQNFSQLSEIRFFAFIIPAILGMCLILAGRLRIGAVPHNTGARSPIRWSAFFTFLGTVGFLGLFGMIALGMQGGFVPALHPTGDVMKADAPMIGRITEYLNVTLMPSTDNPGVVQRFGLFAFLIGFKFAEFFFACTLGRIASSVRHLPAANGITFVYGLLASLGTVFLFGLVGYELFGQSTAKNVWSPKWYDISVPVRTAIVCGVVVVFSLFMVVIYTRMIGRVRRICIEQAA